MNEQEMILREKIEKREKFDTVLAYILLVILLGCIVLVLYLKFVKKEETKSEEYVPNYISLNEISNSLNSSLLANRYMNDSVSFGAIASGNSLIVTYIKDDINLNLNMPVVGNELVIVIDEEHREIVTSIYKEIASIICMYYGNSENYCRNTLDNIGENSIDGIRFVTTDNTTTVYVTTTRSYTVNSEIVYNNVTEVNIDDTDYSLEMLDIRVSNISNVISNTSIKFNGDVERLTEDNSNMSIIVKLYDANGNVLVENKYEYNEENVFEGTGTFEIEFLLSEALKLDNINKYSIEIIK